MTWRYMLRFLLKMEESKLDDRVQVWDVSEGEFYPCELLEMQGDDIIDDGQLFIAIKED